MHTRTARGYRSWGHRAEWGALAAVLPWWQEGELDSTVLPVADPTETSIKTGAGEQPAGFPTPSCSPMSRGDTGQRDWPKSGCREMEEEGAAALEGVRGE